MTDRVVGQHRLEVELGRGTYGTVWRASHVHDPELKVAIKLLHPALSADPDFVAALRTECRQLDALDHPSIVRFRGLVVEDGAYAMILELLVGEDLFTRLCRGPRPVAEVAEVIERALEGLAYAHGRGVVHRDIKPGNLFLCADGRVKLLDFGIARAVDPKGTRTGTLTGTFDYLAPERFSGDNRPAGDVYALGLVAWELLAGRMACPEGGLPQKMAWHLGEGPEPIERIRPDVPAGLARAIAAMVDRDPRARPPTGAEALALWREAGRAPTVRGPPPTVSARRGEVPPELPPRTSGAPATVIARTTPSVEVEVEPVVPQVAAPAPPARRRWRVAAAVLLALVAVGLAGVGVLSGLGALGVATLGAGEPEVSPRPEVDPTPEWKPLLARLSYDAASEAEVSAFAAKHPGFEPPRLWAQQLATERDWKRALATPSWTAEADAYRIEAIARRPRAFDLAVVGRDGGVTLVDTRSGAIGARWTSGRELVTRTAAAWSPDGALLATGRLTGEVEVWKDGRRVAVCEGLKGRVRDLAWSGDGARLLASGAGAHAWTASCQDLGPVRAASADARLVAWDAVTAAVEQEDGAVLAVPFATLIPGAVLVPSGPDVTALAPGLAARGGKLWPEGEVPVHVRELTVGDGTAELLSDRQIWGSYAGEAAQVGSAEGPGTLSDVEVSGGWVYVAHGRTVSQFGLRGHVDFPPATEARGWEGVSTPIATLRLGGPTGDVVGRYEVTSAVRRSARGICAGQQEPLVGRFVLGPTGLAKVGDEPADFPIELADGQLTLDFSADFGNDTPSGWQKCGREVVFAKASVHDGGARLVGAETREDAPSVPLPSSCVPEEACAYAFEVTWTLR